MKDSPTANKVVTYYCSGCKLEIIRKQSVAFKKQKSFCAYAGRYVQMRRLRWKRS